MLLDHWGENVSKPVLGLLVSCYGCYCANWSCWVTGSCSCATLGGMRNTFFCISNGSTCAAKTKWRRIAGHYGQGLSNRGMGKLSNGFNGYGWENSEVGPRMPGVWVNSAWAFGEVRSLSVWSQDQSQVLVKSGSWKGSVPIQSVDLSLLRKDQFQKS